MPRSDFTRFHRIRTSGQVELSDRTLRRCTSSRTAMVYGASLQTLDPDRDATTVRCEEHSGKMVILTSPWCTSRWLVVAGRLVCVWFALAFVSAGAALSHPGHRHGAAVQDAVSPQAVTSIAEVIPASIIAARARDAFSGSALCAQVAETPVDATASATTADATGWKSKASCSCGGTCGSCASVSCCGAVLAPLSDQQFTRPDKVAPTPTNSSGLHDVEVAPLPRPPNPHLPA